MHRTPMADTLSAIKILALTLLVLSGLSACTNGNNDIAAASTTVAKLFAPTPDADDFYSAPKEIPDAPGTILKSRSISYQPAGILLPNPAWQLQYVTRDANGRPLAAVTTVVKPTVPSPYGHPVLVSFQHAYDSLGPICTPSHTATGSTSNSSNMAETLEFMPGLQTLGWTVVIPDYEGPNHSFGAGPVSGQATLDSIRAALQFEPLGLSNDTPVGLWGYSGGAFASTWAAALHPSYAPELQVIAVAAGGTPADMFDVIRRKEGTGDFNFLFTLVMGIAREYPELLTAPMLTEKGVQATAALNDACVGSAAPGSTLAGSRLSDYIAADDPYSTPGFRSVMPKVTLLQSALQPTADIYLFHETNDQLVPVEGADQLAAKWCAAGVPLNYYHSTAATAAGNTPAGVHVAGAAIGSPAAAAYLTGRFGGSPIPLTPPGTVRCN